jgi:hypothetical protein
MKRKRKIKIVGNSEKQREMKMSTAEYHCSVHMQHGFLTCYFIQDY